MTRRGMCAWPLMPPFTTWGGQQRFWRRLLTELVGHVIVRSLQLALLGSPPRRLGLRIRGMGLARADQLRAWDPAVAVVNATALIDPAVDVRVRMGSAAHNRKQGARDG